jgi:FKBP-type peptidyl-prolyl cis-trans isomerase FkpA
LKYIIYNQLKGHHTHMNNLLKKSTLIIAGALVLGGLGLLHLYRHMNPTASQPAEVTFKDTQEGSGAVAEKGQIAVVQYTTYLKEGMKKIDSSYDRKSAFEFRLGSGQVVAGWDKGTQGMRVGGKRTIDVPSKDAYGEKGAGTIVPPNSELVYETELVSLKEYQAPVAPTPATEAPAKSSPKTSKKHK